MKKHTNLVTVTLLLIIAFFVALFFYNIIYTSFYNANYKHFQEEVLEVIEKQSYIDFKDIISKDWDEMYILNLRKDIDTYSNIYDIDFSNINLPFRDRDYYQLIIFYKDNKIISYGYLTIDRIILAINPQKDIPILRHNSKFNVKTDNNYRYTLYK